MSQVTESQSIEDHAKEKSSASLLTFFKTYSAFLVLGISLLLAASLLWYFQSNQGLNEESDQVTVRQEMHLYAGHISKQLSHIFQEDMTNLKELSEAKLSQAVLKNFDENKAQAFSKKFLPEFKLAHSLRILPAGIREIDNHKDLPLSYAVLDMVMNAQKQETMVPIEWHFPGQENESILLVQRVNDKVGQLLGTLVLGLSVDPVHEVFAKTSKADKGFTEILQKTNTGAPIVLIETGDRKRAAKGELVSAVVEHTRWITRVKSYPPAVIQKNNLFQIAWLLLLAIGLGCFFWLKKKSQSKKVLGPRKRSVEINSKEVTKDIEEYIGQVPEIEVDEFEKTYTDEQLAEEFMAIDEDGEVANSELKVEPVDEALHAPASIFRAYDIRGVVGETLTEQVVYNIGRALGSEAQARGDNTVVVGRDGRLSSPSLSESLIQGLTDSGRDVIDIGMVPTPVLYFGANFFETRSGIMITGSHNPPDYNGIKMVLAGTTLADDAIQDLRHRILNNDYSEGQGSSKTVEIGSEYIRRITDDIPVAITNSYKIVVDAGNGVAGQLGPQLIRALGHDVVELFCEIDGNFPNHHPDPSQPENLVDLINTIKSEDADLGLAFDGDGDRLGVVDREGNVIWPDRQMMLFACDVLERNPGCEILFDVKCSNHLQRVIEEAGGKATMWKTGHSLIKGKMKESGAQLAGEMSGHVFFKERWYGFDDGLYTAARLLEILVKSEQQPHEIFAALPGGVATPELKLDMHEDQHKAFMASLIESADFGDGTIGTIDGVRVDFADGWGLIRPSNTTPCLVMRFEADNADALQRIQDLFKAQLLALDENLILPY